MPKILQITSDTVTIGYKDGTMEDFPIYQLNFAASVGDRVEIHRSHNRVIISQKETAISQRSSYYEQQPIVINNNNINSNTQVVYEYSGYPKSKWVALFLCFFFGYLGAHKFYEGRIGMGLLYLFTGGLFGIGWFFNTIGYLFKPNPYYV